MIVKRPAPDLIRGESSSCRLASLGRWLGSAHRGFDVASVKADVLEHPIVEGMQPGCRGAPPDPAEQPVKQVLERRCPIGTGTLDHAPVHFRALRRVEHPIAAQLQIELFVSVVHSEVLSAGSFGVWLYSFGSIT